MAVFRKSPWLRTMSFLVLMFLLQTCMGQTTTQPECANTDPDPDCQHDLTGATDIVFLMDRSGSTSEDHFNYTKDFARQILKKHTIISPCYTRVAVISFGGDVTEDINCINASNAASYECGEFLSGPFETKVQFQNGITKSTTMQEEFVGKYCKYCHKY